MRKLALIVGLVLAAILAPGAGAGIDVAITAPVAGAHSLSGVVPVMISASADAGIYSVQLEVDGVPYGIPDSSPIGPYQYEIDWDTGGITPGDHTLTVLATDWSQIGGGARLASGSVTVDVGPPYPTVSLTAPLAYTFVKGTVQLAASATGGFGSTTVGYAVDLAPLPSSSWNTANVSDGSHIVAATATDGRGKTATASVPVTVDNTPPSTSMLSPTANTFATGSLAASALASDAYGVQSVQFMIDGASVGAALTAPDGGSGYTYSQTLSLGGLAKGTHTLTAVAVDQAGNAASSAPVSFTVGIQPLAATISAPPDWTFAKKTVAIGIGIVGGAAPYSSQLYVDGKASGAPVTTTPGSISWDTSKVPDGSHTISVAVTDSSHTTVSTATVHQTVDNTPAVGVMYQPAQGARVNGPITIQVHASDANGVASVRFSVDGTPIGALLTQPDSGQFYLFSVSFDVSVLTAGTHQVAATVIDNAGNVTIAAPVAITTGPLQYLPVLNYHGIDVVPPDAYELTLAQADQQLAYLKANGYQSVTLEQYQQWLGGADIGVPKPVLITVDDALTDQLAWDALLQKYGFKAILFVITGFADETTPGDVDPQNHMSWSTIQSLAANGRWEIAFHAGRYGHGDSYDTDGRIGTQSYTSACPYFYTCLSQSTSGRGRTRQTTIETVAAYKTAVTSEVTQGMTELKQKVPTASFVAWAAPFNDAGQWTTFYNDPSGQVQSWLPGFMAARFPITFIQTDPTVYGQASGLVGSLTSYGRHYRLEVRTDTTLAQYAAALTGPAFAR